jgi:hypothetical protein
LSRSGHGRPGVSGRENDACGCSSCRGVSLGGALEDRTNPGGERIADETGVGVDVETAFEDRCHGEFGEIGWRDARVAQLQVRSQRRLAETMWGRIARRPPAATS